MKSIRNKQVLCTTHPSLCSEWHPTANLPLTPEDVSPGSRKSVWWCCKKRHEWKTRVEHRTKARTGCPFCAGQRATREDSLGSVAPEIAKEWHTEKNGNLTPFDVLPQSNKKVWWHCLQGHEWQTVIAHRFSNTQCPYCAHSLASPEFNLATKLPEIAAEWNPTKNGDTTPSKVLPSASRKYWWLCPNGHDYQMTVNHRASGNNCPYCSNKKTGYGNTLAARFPEIAREWHPDRNGDLTPDQVVFGSNARAWWKCIRGHEWRTQIVARTTYGTGCPKCNLNTSKVELRLLAEMRWMVGQVHHQHKIEGKEFDLYAPAAGICVEVDGARWHADKLAHDLLKVRICEANGLHLIRVRGFGLPEIKGDVIWFADKQRTDLLPICKEVAHRVLNKGLCDAETKTRLTQYLVAEAFCNDEAYKEFLSLLPGVLPEKAITATHPEIARQWNEELNSPLKPEMFSAGSGQKIWWLCEKGHSWDAYIYSRTGVNAGCPYCSNLKADDNSCLLATHPQIAAEWHPDKNGTLTARVVVFGSGRKVWWQCEKGHEWEADIEKRTKGKQGCPYCSGRRTGADNNLAILYPNVAAQWHPTRNGKLRPEDIRPGSAMRAWWKCNKGHEWPAVVNARVRGNGCPTCAGKVPHTK